MIKKLENLAAALDTLCIFRDVLDDPVIAALKNFLESDGDERSVGLYCEFVSKLYKTGRTDFAKYVAELTRCCDNPLVKKIGRQKPVREVMRKSAEYELEILNGLAALSPKTLREGIEYGGALPEWTNSKIDIAEEFRNQAENIGKHGYGIFAKYTAFYFDGEIKPVKTPDSVRLCDLVGYQREKKLIIDNTESLLEGKPAANILLTGDAGTGKSSTVKAVVNELSGEGLRILELKKDQLGNLPKILFELNRNPLKFIIFIDDLSFAKNDDNFSALKAVLEGSVSAKAGNVVIYATSNRRHLVRESFSDRDGDDVHRGDTMQEIVSLSERFGLHVTFSRPDKATYLEIVRHILDENGVEYDPEKLEADAERFALSRASRSARAAKQFADMVLAGRERV